MKYNPFDKDIDYVEVEDLNTLKENGISEGWFVEFKKNFQSVIKISHSIAAFANSDGGWYIVGVNADNNDNAADEIIGFDLNDNKQSKERIRDIIKSNISPVPFFKSRLVEIGNNRAVLLVYVERGLETPYITKDGRIYRRVGEGSDPVAETDRYTIQRLFERQNQLTGYIEKFSKRLCPLASGQERQSFLELYFFTSFEDRFMISNFRSKEFIEELRTIFNRPVPFMVGDFLKMSLRFNSVYTSLGSYILRDVNPGLGALVSLLVEIFENGNSKMIMPIEMIDSTHRYYKWNKRYGGSEFYKEFLDLISNEEREHIRIIDGYSLFCGFIILFSHYCAFLKEKGYNNTLKARFKFVNTLRILVYFDDGNYVNYVKANGLPICMVPEIEVPEFFDGGLTRSFGMNSEEAVGILGFFFEALGIPMLQVPDNMIEGLSKYLTDTITMQSIKKE